MSTFQSLMTLVMAVGTACAGANEWHADLARASSAEVTFDAVGKPSLLQIHGKSGSAPKGRLIFSGRSLTGTARFDLRTLETGISLRDTHMKEKYLETGKFPEATLEFHRTALPSDFGPGKKMANVPFEGDLTLHGKKKAVRGKLTLDPSGSSVVVHAQFVLQTPDFGIARPAYAGISLADAVTANVALTAPFAR